MKIEKNIINLLWLFIIFIGLPVFFYAVGDFPRRNYLKESISVATLVAFFLMFGQFFLSRTAFSSLSGYGPRTVIKIHKVIGYVFLPLLLAHPFLLVVPRYFGSGADSIDAFLTIITSFESRGVVLGMIAWGLMLLLLITSFFRKLLPFSYKTWRLVHGLLSVLFIAIASWHALLLGRHVDLLLSGYLFLLLLLTVGFWVKSNISYVAATPVKKIGKMVPQ